MAAVTVRDAAAAGGRTRLSRLRPRATDLVDVLAYLVVLNLAIQLFPSVISESFSLSLLTAVLLKLVLEVVVVAKGRARAAFGRAESVPAKVGAGLLLWLVLVGSKFVVLELVDLLFGDRVSLGGFVSVTALIVVLLVARAATRRMLRPASEQVALP